MKFVMGQPSRELVIGCPCGQSVTISKAWLAYLPVFVFIAPKEVPQAGILTNFLFYP